MPVTELHLPMPGQIRWQQYRPDEDEMLGQEITLLAGQINAANHRLLKLIAEFDRRKGWSGGGTASHVEKVVCKYKSVQATDDDVAVSEQDNARKLVYYQDSDGMWVIHAKLPPEAGAMVVKAIQAIAAPEQAERQVQIRQEMKDSQQDVSAETSVDALSCGAPDVDAGTCVTSWRGEDCDYGMAVEALLWRDEGDASPRRRIGS